MAFDRDNITEETWAAFDRFCANVDRTYGMANGRAYYEGKANMDRLRGEYAILQGVDKARADAIWEKHKAPIYG